MLRLAVLISGQGSNLQAILDAVAARRLAANVALVVSNRADAAGLVRAQTAGVPTQVLSLRARVAAGRTRRDFDAELADLVAAAAPDVVVLAGWTHILSSAFLDRFPERVINLHPALPGEWPGLDAIGRAWRHARAGGRPCTGVTVHRVVEAVDAGMPLAVEQVPIAPDDTLADLDRRVHGVEHRLLVGVLAAWSAASAHTSAT